MDARRLEARLFDGDRAAACKRRMWPTRRPVHARRPEEVHWRDAIHSELCPLVLDEEAQLLNRGAGVGLGVLVDKRLRAVDGRRRHVPDPLERGHALAKSVPMVAEHRIGTLNGRDGGENMSHRRQVLTDLLM